MNERSDRYCTYCTCHHNNNINNKQRVQYVDEEDVYNHCKTGDGGFKLISRILFELGGGGDVGFPLYFQTPFSRFDGKKENDIGIDYD